MIEVKLTKRKGRKFIDAYFDDPETGKRYWKSTGETVRKKAEKFQRTWQTEINNGKYKPASKKTLEEFWEEYQRHKLPTYAPSTQDQRYAVVQWLRKLEVKNVSQVATAPMMTELQTLLREDGLSDTTIKSYLGHLRSMWTWAVKNKFIGEVPEMDPPEVDESDEIGGRPLTDEEFDKLLKAVPEVRKTGDEAIWQDFLRGLWFSGLRLEEGLRLSWDPDSDFAVWTKDELPKFKIEKQKRKTKQMAPMAPEFWDFIKDQDRTGFVLPLPNGRGGQLSTKRASRTIADIGRKAEIVTKEGTHASAHDLRRSFGTRWAKRLKKPLVLHKLMRHSKLETTIKYYAKLDSDWLADEVFHWEKQTGEKED